VGHRVAQPLQHQQPLFAAERLEQVHIQHLLNMADS
jgi:hypothetical protein